MLLRLIMELGKVRANVIFDDLFSEFVFLITAFLFLFKKQENKFHVSRTDYEIFAIITRHTQNVQWVKKKKKKKPLINFNTNYKREMKLVSFDVDTLI